MGGGQAHPLHRHGTSPLHRLPAEMKIVALVVFVLAVVATPRDMLWPFAIYALILLGLWRLARIPLRWVLPRMLIEMPFLVLAVLLPFSVAGERVVVAGLTLSVPGLYAAWGIVAKGTLGVAAALTLAATTTASELPLALSRLRVPGLVTSVLVLMVRYIDVLNAEAHRMRMARLSRGDSPRALHQAGAVAAGAGALFLRSYERGERVYLAMLSRGYDGTVPASALDARVPPLALDARVPASALDAQGAERPSAPQWTLALLPAGGAVMVAATAWLLR